MPEVRVPDASERERALDPETSFIVQAPAGSGKTGLLIQRVLVLLARVEAPEEIVAITFTRKAAAEMRERVLQALAAAESEQPPDDAHARTTWQLAKQVLARGATLGWQLRDSPQRLRIQTIDSFCAGLGRQLPYLSGLGGPPQLTEEAEPLYREAARAALATLEHGGDDGAAVARAVAHRDADLEGIETLIAALLGKRDQWLRHLHDDDSPEARRERLEATVRTEVAARLGRLSGAFSVATLAEAGELAATAAAELVAAGADPGALTPWLDDDSALATDETDLSRWQGLADLLLTTRGEWRKSLNIKQGFPPPGKAQGAEKDRREAHKKRAMALLDALRDDTALAGRLHEVHKLPAARYSDDQWAVLGAIARLLVLAAAHLKLVFTRRGQVDFLEVAQRANAALVDDGVPTDLALALDYRIAHLLVDEFQDTSKLQNELLERLTEGWVPGDGRTLFLVGDPMQSIYRFREAEVALFLAATEGRLGGIALEPLRLSANFRSQAGLVEWFNDAFPGILAPANDTLAGAVPYVPAGARRAAASGPAVSIHPQLDRDDEAEAATIIRLIGEARAERPDGRVAVLVRGRPHLRALLPRLRSAGLRFRAVDVEKLAAQPAVELLLALTRALLHRGDRVAWLALLRGPACGLELADLLALVGDDFDTPLPALLADPARLARLTVDGRARVIRAYAVLRSAQDALGRSGLRRRGDGTGRALGGPAAAGGEAGLQAADAFLELLASHADGGTLPDPDTFADALDKLYAPPDPEADDRLQLMTVHKAKGLEFDTVILPGLGRKTGGDHNPMLAWMEPPDGGLLMAPIDARGTLRDPLYRWIRKLENTRIDNETGRLLYVAATRARERLHLLGAADTREKDGEFTVKAPGNTFLDRLWPRVGEVYETLLHEGVDEDDDDGTPGSAGRRMLTRLPLDWIPPAMPEAVTPLPDSAVPEPTEPVIFDWAGESARAAGTAVHRLLEAWGEGGLPEGDRAPPGTSDYVCTALRERGLSGKPLNIATERVERAVARTLADPRGRWLFDPTHTEARSELALTAQLDDELVSLVIDRTFVDTDGVRWIVDFKTSDHRGGGLDTFLDREQARYREQLERYGRVMARLDPRPQRLALYFPLAGGWREWESGGEG